MQVPARQDAEPQQAARVGPAAQLDFGAVGIGDEKVLQIGIFNDGAQQDLIIESISKGDASGQTMPPP